MRTKKKLKVDESPLIVEHLKKHYDELNVKFEDLLIIEKHIILLNEDELNLLVDKVYKEPKYRNRLLRYLVMHKGGVPDKTKYSSLGVSIDAKKDLLNLKGELGLQDLDMSDYITEICKRIRNEN
jgi:hypothetical protein